MDLWLSASTVTMETEKEGFLGPIRFTELFREALEAEFTTGTTRICQHMKHCITYKILLSTWISILTISNLGVFVASW
jgi:hypothetical protein